MENIPESTAAPITVKLSDGREFTLSPLSFQQIGEIQLQMRNDYETQALESISKYPEQIQMALAREVFDIKPHVSFSPMFGKDPASPMTKGAEFSISWTSSIHGRIVMLVHALKKKHPDMTTEKLGEILEKEENFQAFMNMFKELNSGEKNESGEGEKKVQPTSP